MDDEVRRAIGRLEAACLVAGRLGGWSDVRFDWDAHRLANHRDAWRRLADRAGMTLRVFRLAVEAALESDGEERPATPQAWVGFAAELAEDVWHDDAERRARRMGFSCRLEAAWAADGEFEATCRVRGLDPDAEAHGGLAADRNSWY